MIDQVQQDLKNDGEAFDGDDDDEEEYGIFIFYTIILYFYHYQVRLKIIRSQLRSDNVRLILRLHTIIQYPVVDILLPPVLLNLPPFSTNVP